MNIEHLRILSPNAIEIGKPGGGHAALTPEDVAAALAGLPPKPYYLGMTIYAADAIAYERLYYYVSLLQEVPACPEAMELKDPVRGILDLCLDELWGDNKCGTCGGPGVIINTTLWDAQTAPESAKQQCPTCRGRGMKKQTDLSRSKIAGIPYEHWPYYREFYDWLTIQLMDWNSRINSHIKKRYGE